jgi:hypothetical protein
VYRSPIFWAHRRLHQRDRYSLLRLRESKAICLPSGDQRAFRQRPPNDVSCGHSHRHITNPYFPRACATGHKTIILPSGEMFGPFSSRVDVRSLWA